MSSQIYKQKQNEKGSEQVTIGLQQEQILQSNGEQIKDYNRALLAFQISVVPLQHRKHYYEHYLSLALQP